MIKFTFNFNLNDLKDIPVEILFAGLGAVLFSWVFALACYIFISIGYMRMLKRLGYAHPAFAWFPVFNSHAIGWIGEQYDTGFPSKKISRNMCAMALSLFIVPLIMSIFGGLSASFGMKDDMLSALIFGGIGALIAIIYWFVYSIVTLAYGVIYYAVTYYAFRIFSAKHPVVLLILSIIFPWLLPFFIFALRNGELSHIRNTCPAYIPPEDDSAQAQDTELPVRDDTPEFTKESDSTEKGADEFNKIVAEQEKDIPESTDTEEPDNPYAALEEESTDTESSEDLESVQDYYSAVTGENIPESTDTESNTPSDSDDSSPYDKAE